MTDAKAVRPHRIRYKCKLALFPAEWDQLEDLAHARKITGEELIESILSQYCRYRLDHPPIPESDEAPEEAE